MNSFICNLCAEEVFVKSPEENVCFSCYEWLILVEEIEKKTVTVPGNAKTVTVPGNVIDINEYSKPKNADSPIDASTTEEEIDTLKLSEFLLKVYTEELETIDFPKFSKDEEIVLLKCLLQITINNNISLKEDLKKQKIHYSTTVYKLLMNMFEHTPTVLTVNKVL